MGLYSGALADKKRWFIWLICKLIWVQTHWNKTNVSLKHNGYAVCSVCVYSCKELIHAIKRLKIKSLGEKTGFEHTHTHTECWCISDTAVISVSCDYVCRLLRWDPSTAHLKSFFGELPYCPSASCLIWKSPYGLLSCMQTQKLPPFQKAMMS